MSESTSSITYPSGTATFLFTDIERSTEMWERHREVMPRALERHDSVMRDVIRASGGRVFKEVGDAFHAVFADAARAVEAAIAIQRSLSAEAWETPEPIRVRVALHAGDAEQRDNDFFGPTLNRTARILAAGHGGQVLLSQSVERLVQDRFPEGTALRDLGERRLKDLARPERIFQLVVEGLDTEFPPLQTLDARPHNLPAQETPLVGRERELRAVRDLVLRQGTRLITLTGPGGTGKTRLALQVAAEVIDAFRDGVFFVNLTSVREPERLPATILQTLDVSPDSGEAEDVALRKWLADRELLLVLDNFEQIVDAAVRVGDLLREAPRLCVLVTSQAALRIRGEHAFPVGPLELPEEGSSLVVLAANDAVELFVERAQAIRPDFELDEENAQAVGAIVRQLDGLPLAIELAATRIQLFTPQALLSRIAQRFDLLSSRARDLPDRHRTLRNAIAWSYDLLDEEDKALFRRQAVFDGGFALDSAEEVCSPPDDPLDILEGLTSLIDKSLLRQRPTSLGEPRFERLRTVLAFAVEILEESGEADTWRRRHAEHFAALAERVDEALSAQREAKSRLDRLALEVDNIRVALKWAVGAREADLAVRLCAAIPALWFRTGTLQEGRTWLEQVLALGSLSEPTRARALNLLGRIRQIGGDNSPEVGAAFEESLGLYRKLGDERGIARALMNLGNLKRRERDLDAAEALFREALAIYESLGEAFGRGAALMNLGDLYSARGDRDEARSLFERAREVTRAGGARIGHAYSLQYLGTMAVVDGLLDQAEDLYEQSRREFADLGARPGLVWSFYYLAIVARERGDLGRARALFGEAIQGVQELGHLPGVALALIGLAGVERAEGHHRRAAILLGAAREIQRRASLSISEVEVSSMREIEAAGREALGDSELERALSEGRSLEVAHAVALALAPADALAS
ncbi:MAG TPA: tetratricopeptide repeat protein [Gemmatimonadota bacterium]|nr:tetratricopeptide repeat protein [Gemmatimonadota bacterium]